MTQVNKKSAKDLAFDKERATFRKEISELKRELLNKSIEISDMKGKVEKLRTEIEEKDDWIRRLLEYTEMSEDDMKNVINKEKVNANISKSLEELLGVFVKYGRY